MRLATFELMQFSQMVNKKLSETRRFCLSNEDPHMQFGLL